MKMDVIVSHFTARDAISSKKKTQYQLVFPFDIFQERNFLITDPSHGISVIIRERVLANGFPIAYILTIGQRQTHSSL